LPILKEGQLEVISYSAEQTQRLGARLGTLLQPGDVLCLSGDMGAGKTVFAAGIGKGWEATTLLTSPTFALVHVHEREKDKQRLYHLDCYRLDSAADADTIGLEEILNGSGPVLFEWPERIKSALPSEHLWADLRVLETTRRLFNFQAIGARHRALLAQFRGTGQSSATE
jgi:tRNA threonylcarbamoyladenosine biosynthesis protein TsaE